MKTAKILCKCLKQVSYIKEMLPDEIQKKEFENLKEDGFIVVQGDDLEKSEPCLQPCLIDCPFAKKFTTKAGKMKVSY